MDNNNLYGLSNQTEADNEQPLVLDIAELEEAMRQEKKKDNIISLNQITTILKERGMDKVYKDFDKGCLEVPVAYYDKKYNMNVFVDDRGLIIRGVYPFCVECSSIIPMSILVNMLNSDDSDPRDTYAYFVLNIQTYEIYVEYKYPVLKDNGALAVDNPKFWKYWDDVEYTVDKHYSKIRHWSCGDLTKDDVEMIKSFMDLAEKYKNVI